MRGFDLVGVVSVHGAKVWMLHRLKRRWPLRRIIIQQLLEEKVRADHHSTETRWKDLQNIQGLWRETRHDLLQGDLGVLWQIRVPLGQLDDSLGQPYNGKLSQTKLK